MAKVVQVIFTKDRRGRGTQDDPMRMVCQLWTLDGQLICEAEEMGLDPRKIESSFFRLGDQQS